MKYLIIFIVVVAVLLYTTNLWRYIQTGFLIAHTKPYTQSGSKGTILVLGDSTGYGTGVRDSKNSVAGRIGAAFPEYTIQNNSVNGRTIEDLTETVTTIEGRYDLILLQIGANDIIKGRTLATVQSDLEAVLTKLRQHTDAIVMISAGNVGAAPAFDTETAAHLTA